VEGKTEVKHHYYYDHPSRCNHVVDCEIETPDGKCICAACLQRSHVRVDCETETHVYECGLDKRSSLDSLQQALFFSCLTGKKPAVVIYDTDGREGKYEYRIRSASEMVNVEYIRFPVNSTK